MTGRPHFLGAAASFAVMLKHGDELRDISMPWRLSEMVVRIEQPLSYLPRRVLMLYNAVL